MAGDASMAFSLPITNVPIGQALDTLIQRKDQEKVRQQEAQAASAAAYQKQQDQNRISNIGRIASATEQSQIKPIAKEVDDYSHNFLKQYQQKALTEYANLDPVELELRMSQDLGQFFDWHNKAQSSGSELDKNLQDYLKDHPGISLSDANAYVKNQFRDDFMGQDATGNYVPRTDIKPRNYFEEMNSSDFIGAFNKDTYSLDEAILNTKIVPISDDKKKYTNARGGSTSIDLVGGVTPFKEYVTDAQGNVVDIKTKGEVVNIGFEKNQVTGESMPINMTVLPQEQAQMIMGNKKAADAAKTQWYQVKQAIEGKFRKDNNGAQITPQVEDILFRKFLYDKIDKGGLDQSVLNKNETVKANPVVNVNNYNSSNAPYNNVFEDITVAVNNKGGKATISDLPMNAGTIVSKLVSDRLGYADQAAYVKLDSDGVMRIYGGDNKIISPISFKDINLIANSTANDKKVLIDDKPAPTNKKKKPY
jgi:hypothetical protein